MSTVKNKFLAILGVITMTGLAACSYDPVSPNASNSVSNNLDHRGGAIEYKTGPKGVRNSDRYIPRELIKQRRLRDGIETTALWTFDEPKGLYPSHAIDDASPNDLVMALGRGAQIGPGKYGNALEFSPQPDFNIPEGEENQARYGFVQLEPKNGRTTPPLSWYNANFAALITDGEDHLRKEMGFTNPTDTDLNLGNFDWTVEFWYQAKPSDSGVVFEIGQGPRGDNPQITQLSLDSAAGNFTLINMPSQSQFNIPTSPSATQSKQWHHFAFTYDESAHRLRHYVDGKAVSELDNVQLQTLKRGEEAYFTVGKNAQWQSGLSGSLDELRFSKGVRYNTNFEVPQSLAPQYADINRKPGPPLLFSAPPDNQPIELGTRKYVFIDDNILQDIGDARLVVNPPKKTELVMGDIQGTFRKHLTVIEDDEGLIRIYNSVEDDYLAVYTSTDGINFERPDTGKGVFNGHHNIAIAEAVGGLGNPFIDPQAPANERWKYFSDSERRGIYLYTSPDGYDWKRVPTSTVPFRSGTQSATFYDDQRQKYVAWHRSGIFHTPAGDTQRSSVVTEHDDLRIPLPYQPLTQQDYYALREKYPLREPLPWFTDNGPLTPGGFGMEFPHGFDPEPFDPVGVDFYLTKATKYEWAPDTYLAFPIAYFHYEHDGPLTREILGEEKFGRGSGPLETQLAISRNGLDWTRLPRPAYIGIGKDNDRDVKTAYIAHGMVRRDDEIWQYYFGETQYHSAHDKDLDGRGVYRVVQRLDGFISLDSPYDKEITVISKPLIFDGNRLQLNIDTDATGYAQIGFLDNEGKQIEGFSVDDCIYVNGDFINTDVEWMGRGKDVSALAGKTVQMVFRMRGAKLYAMNFSNQ